MGLRISAVSLVDVIASGLIPTEVPSMRSRTASYVRRSTSINTSTSNNTIVNDNNNNPNTNIGNNMNTIRVPVGRDGGARATSQRMNNNTRLEDLRVL